jgi:hypothetical protein
MPDFRLHPAKREKIDHVAAFRNHHRPGRHWPLDERPRCGPISEAWLPQKSCGFDSL